jgi:hypothetical protein
VRIEIGIDIEIGSTGEAFDNPDPDPVRSMVLHRKT